MRKSIYKVLLAVMICVMVISAVPMMGFAAAAVSNVNYIANTAGGVKIAYTAVDGATAYAVLRKAGDGEFEQIAKTTALTYIDKKAENATAYTYAVDAITEDDVALTGNTKSVTYVAAPKFELVNTAIGVQITVEELEGVTNYEVKRKDPGASAYVKVANIKPGDLSYIDNTIPENGKYTYQVVANNGKSFSYFYTSSIEAEVAPYMPDDCKTAINYIANTAAGIKVAFPLVDGEEVYTLYRKEADGSWKSLGNTKFNTYNDKNVKNNVTYSYAVAIKGYRFQEADAKSITFVSTPKFTLENAGSGVRLTINPVEGVTKYEIKRTEKAGSSKYIKLGEVKASDEPYFIDKTVEDETTYTYQVVACIGKSFSYYYTGKILTDLEEPAEAPKTTVSNTNSGVKVAYETNPDATQYFLYRKDSENGKWNLISSMYPTNYCYFIDKTAKSGNVYSYAVSYTTKNDYSGIDAEAAPSILYLKDPKVTLTNVENGVQIDFEEVPGADNYIVYRKTGSGFVKIANPTADEARTFVDTAAVEGGTYTYAVRGFKGTKQASYLNPVTITYTAPAAEIVD